MGTTVGTTRPVATGSPTSAVPAAHCQVPCGIYTDKMRIDMLMEDCATIEKAMVQLAEAPDTAQARQQFVRWVTTKEAHAQNVQDVVAQYWLAQRIKPLTEGSTAEENAKYFAQLSNLHHITVHAMKCKQGLDTSSVKSLRESAKAFSESYFSAEDLEHLSGHHWK